MPPEILAQPDNGPTSPGTPTVPAGHGWLQAALDAVHGSGKEPWQTPVGAVAQLSLHNAAFAVVPAALFVSAVFSRTHDGAVRLLACVVVSGLFVAFMALRIGWCIGTDQGVLDHAQVVSFQARSAAVAERQAATRRMAIKLRRQPVGEGYLYVMEFSTGTVKVGQTEDPKVRLATHRREADAFGVYVVNYWISPSHMNFRDNEIRLINQCAKVSHRSRKEYFHAVGYEQAVAFANALTYYSKNLEQVS
ncbi:hypothetical protein ACWKSP_22435, partial [Micromonosporaceae bacterium Da 78-11]